MGGDFYDLFEARGSWAVVIGDVCGKGASAASLTSLCRHAVRTLGRHDPLPSQVLADLNETIMREPDVDLRFSTAAYARLAWARRLPHRHGIERGSPAAAGGACVGPGGGAGGAGDAPRPAPDRAGDRPLHRARPGRRAGALHRRGHRGAERRGDLRRRAPARPALRGSRAGRPPSSPRPSRGPRSRSRAARSPTTWRPWWSGWTRERARCAPAAAIRPGPGTPWPSGSSPCSPRSTPWGSWTGSAPSAR